ncbi:MAG: carbon-nitrogen hydrolase family protein [Candidatus Margulisbacteria bacterium]|nr:carbon-nitrogen hydrolase family protein [Candidatus Margulisiibacteriota bacterium]
MKTLTVALIQLKTGTDIVQNQAVAHRLIKEAAKAGARFILLPEVFHYRGDRGRVLENAEVIPGPAVLPLMAFAKECDVWILGGSLCEIGQATHKVYNTSVLINPQGHVQATYRKMHLFDAIVNGKPIRESDIFLAGDMPVMADVDGISTGLSICYDVRFPELYRHYAALGAKILCVPSSFTTPTGSEHWEVLLRARAIENYCYVLAPNQAGIGACDVPTFGNSMIIDPWGKIVARASEHDEEIVMATLDFNHLENLRARFPALKNRRHISQGIENGFDSGI